MMADGGTFKPIYSFSDELSLLPVIAGSWPTSSSWNLCLLTGTEWYGNWRGRLMTWDKYNNEMTKGKLQDFIILQDSRESIVDGWHGTGNYKGLRLAAFSACKQKEHRKNPERKELSEEESSRQAFRSINSRSWRGVQDDSFAFWGLIFTRLGTSSRQQTTTPPCVRWRCRIQRNMARQNDYNILRLHYQGLVPGLPGCSAGARYCGTVRGRKDGVFLWIRRGLNCAVRGFPFWQTANAK